MKKILITIFITNIIVLCMSASIIDLISSSDGSGRQNDAGSKNCICKELSCICCLDFNISFIDLGGPGCVRLHYLSPDEGVAINVSYGDSLLHNEVVKGPDPPPSCLNIFAKLAQMCARFNGLVRHDDGLKGCVSLEPMLLGEAQLELPIGCFKMSPRGMEVIPPPPELQQQQQAALSLAELDKTDGNSTAEDGDEGPDSLAGYTAEDLLSAVNESAQQGIALLSNWLGLAPNATANDATAATDAANSIGSTQQQQQQHQQYQQQQQQIQQQQQQQHYIQPQSQHHVNNANQYHLQSQQPNGNPHIVFGS